jgi:lipopolysaccharide transport system permease protein
MTQAPEPAPAEDLPVTIIERRSAWSVVNLRELWRYRELLWFLTWRDIKVRYKQTVLGVAWAVLQPLATMAAFTLFLGRATGVAEGLTYPYSLFVFAGLLPWLFFAGAVSSAGQSVVGNQNLVTKVYFPRLIIPFSAVGVGLLDFLIGLGLLLVLMGCNGVWPAWGFLCVVPVMLLLILAALGIGTLLAALTVAYRDFRFVVPFLVQLWMFATPSIYMRADQVLGPRGQALLPLNPAYGLIVNFRQAALGGPLDWYALCVSALVSIGLMVIGFLYFRRVERSFADII